MDRLGHLALTDPMSDHTGTTPLHHLESTTVLDVLDRRTYAVLATSSPAGWPHTAGVLYQLVGHQLYASTLRSSRKARNLAANPRAAVTVPVRRMPVGPPSAVQFQAEVEILDLDDPDLRRLVEAGKLKKVTGHGELELPGGCFLRITPRPRLNTYGLGMSLLQLMRDPINAAGYTQLAA
jgi:hypothetical protein